jgi:hypothetical protein
MKNKNNEMYALMGQIDYQGSILMGIYSSKENAQKALDIIMPNGSDGEYRIEGWIVDAAADSSAY